MIVPPRLPQLALQPWGLGFTFGAVDLPKALVVLKEIGAFIWEPSSPPTAAVEAAVSGGGAGGGPG